MKKQRFAYACAAALFVMLGLASRSGGGRELPDWIAAHAGDALWAGMIYWCFRMCAPHWKPLTAAVGSALVCALVECSQLYQADWINEIRAATLGALVLGHGFLGIDLIRYAAGVAAAWGIECAAGAVCQRTKNN
ncbi:ribosomal maturation YjgA family protein [Paenibacillus silvisoli]|uniref:ribosomal maturation YjgA family protein n=1 Tax=Paenibacillus silvisoli TaxID=3110539 RepID=UPI002805A421|nr:DUF2809 domain-containing protein [Paenibacillus silvisoli]